MIVDILFLVGGVALGVVFAKTLKGAAQHPVATAAEVALPAAKAVEASAAK